MTLCPKCKSDITTMKGLNKPRKFKWICKKCGKDVSKIKLKQLVEDINEVINA